MVLRRPEEQFPGPFWHQEEDRKYTLTEIRIRFCNEVWVDWRGAVVYIAGCSALNMLAKIVSQTFNHPQSSLSIFITWGITFTLVGGFISISWNQLCYCNVRIRSITLLLTLGSIMLASGNADPVWLLPASQRSPAALSAGLCHTVSGLGLGASRGVWVQGLKKCQAQGAVQMWTLAHYFEISRDFRIPNMTPLARF